MRYTNGMTIKHGKYNTPSYISWYGMKTRCNNPNDKMYHAYGGRGIKVCPEWDDFVGFYNDMGDRPDGHELDRIDTNKDYSKDNCRWTDRLTNMRNRTNTRKANIDGETYTLIELSERYNIPYERINKRYTRGKRDIELIK